MSEFGDGEMRDVNQKIPTFAKILTLKEIAERFREVIFTYAKCFCLISGCIGFFGLQT